jgi:glucokinase
MEYRSIGPLVFVVGGLGPSGDILLVPLRTEVTGRITWQRTPRTERAAIGDRAGLPGAACLAWDAL